MEDLKSPLGMGKERPWLMQRPSSSVGFSASLRKIGEEDIDVDKEMAKVEAGLRKDGGETDYSDFEDDVTAVRDRDVPGWSPGFLRQHRDSGGSSTTSQQTAVERTQSSPAPEGAVPATPSLIKALDRIAIAQQAAFGAVPRVRPLRPGLPSQKSSEPAMTSGLPKPQLPLRADSAAENNKAANWDTFWKEVREKARHGQ